MVKKSTQNSKNNRIEQQAEARINSKLVLFRGLFTIFFLLLTGYFSYRIYSEYQFYVAPENVYGEWIEIGAPPYLTERLTLSEQGVFRNNRLIATQYQFDGERIMVETGGGLTIYQLTGSESSPQLRRLQPATPVQRFVKKGYEDTITDSATGGAQNRRAALSEHFN
ncbi:DUF2850 domain-containing protein [Vibrio sp. IRLE0018]|uniref:DUF2850 domain-containing protein n=1 Tax=Vibrio floridensis TaxID=2908007 RepID=UPI001A349F26|nr:DUF2850 domain-containing protein [Vibrio floridensis]MCF8777214.1 DUF2850 domain-containing protein [Vibrio floridensis]HAS6346382.1 DUF2850 domain-containing protein [Vibrio vulnificus]